MYQFKGLEDTIVAISSSTGSGGIGIVRISGQDALAVADKMFVAKNKKKPSQFKSYSLHYGWVVRNKAEEIIDEALLTVMRSPNSYTKEDVVEFSCHGGIVPLKAILTLAVEYGARLADPGEFTKRAFINGRIDLTQAEAVLDIIQAKTDAFLKVSTHQLKGELSSQLEEIRMALMEIYTELEANVNFPEEDIDDVGRKKILAGIQQEACKVDALLKTSDEGRILKEGIKVVLCGRPNVGKSSLLNVFLKQPRSIVTEIEGTTRDSIEEVVQINGIPFNLVDTAGILHPRDVIEEEAVKRSQMHMESADIILLIVDSSQGLVKKDKELIEEMKDKNIVLVLNKSDLPTKVDEKNIQSIINGKTVKSVSALNKNGVEALQKEIVANVWHGKAQGDQSVLISNVRHIEALRNCFNALRNAVESLHNELSYEFISEEIKLAVNNLDNITGRNIDEDLLDQIFSSFCIGK